MVKRILSYILFGTGLLTFMFFRQYDGTLIPYPFLFWLSGIAAILLAGALFVSSAKDNAKRRNNHFSKLIEDLKVKGEKMHIDFSQCDILENSYMEERERYSSGNIQTWNMLLDPEKNIETVGINQSVLVYNHEHQGVGKKNLSAACYPMTVPHFCFTWIIRKPLRFMSIRKIVTTIILILIF